MHNPQSPNPIPQDQPGWLREIAAAYRDAKEAIPFSRFIRQPITEADLFHLAPQFMLKMRGLRWSRNNLKRATDAGLASYVANRERQPEMFADPVVAFAFCYLAAHLGLDLVQAEAIDDLISCIEDHSGELRKLIHPTVSGCECS